METNKVMLKTARRILHYRSRLFKRIFQFNLRTKTFPRIMHAEFQQKKVSFLPSFEAAANKRRTLPFTRSPQSKLSIRALSYVISAIKVLRIKILLE